VPEDLMGRRGVKALLGRREQFGEILFQSDDDVESPIAGVMQEGSAGEFPVGDHLGARRR